MLCCIYSAVAAPPLELQQSTAAAVLPTTTTSTTTEIPPVEATSKEVLVSDVIPEIATEVSTQKTRGIFINFFFF